MDERIAVNLVTEVVDRAGLTFVLLVLAHLIAEDEAQDDHAATLSRLGEG